MASESLAKCQQRTESRQMMSHAPFDCKPSDPRLLSKDVAADLLNDGLARWLRGQLLVHVFVVHVVSHAHKLASIISASEKDDCNTENLSVGDAAGVRRVRFEDELVDARRDWADEEAVKLLVVLGTNSRVRPLHQGPTRVSAPMANAGTGQIIPLCGSDVSQFPLEILLEILQALECDFELVRRVERRRVVEDFDVEKSDYRHLGYLELRWSNGR